MTMSLAALTGMATVFAWTALAAAADAQALRAPLYLIVSGDDAIVTGPSSALPRRAIAGTEIFGGETLKSDTKPVVFAFCGAKKGQPGIYSLAAHAVIQAEELSSRRVTGLQLLEPIHLCEYPKVREAPVASTIDEPSTRSAFIPQLEEQIARLPSEEQSQIRDRLAQSQLLVDGKAYALIGYATRAATLERFGLIDLALVALRVVKSNWAGATWTRDVISRLTEERIIQPDVNFDSDPGAGVSVVPLTATVPPLTGETYALLIGISHYDNGGIPALHFADKDAELFRDYLLSPRGGQLKPAQIQLLLNGDATRERIENGIARLVRGKANRNSTLIVFVAAHGTMLCAHSSGSIDTKALQCEEQAEQPFILTFDSDPSDGKTTGISMGAFRDLVTARARDFGRVLVFVDVCHAVESRRCRLKHNYPHKG